MTTRVRVEAVDGGQAVASRTLTRRELLRGLGSGAAVGLAALTGSPWHEALAAPSASLRGPQPARPPAGSPHTIAAEHSADVATAWFDLLGRLVAQSPGFSPPVASRAFGYAGVVLYETVVAGMPDHRSLADQLRDHAGGMLAVPRPHGGPHDWTAAANAALAAAARQLWPDAEPTERVAIVALESRLARDASVVSAPGLLRRSEDWGRQIATAVLAWARGDGGNDGHLSNFPPDYEPPHGPGLWVPTPPGFLSALQPHWGNNRPFVLPSNAACPPGTPPPYDESPGSTFHADAVEVYDTVNQLSPEQRMIARFWADDPGETATPPGHSIAITGQLLREDDASLAAAAEAYVKAGTAVADAFIACWRAKYQVNLLRPVTYIQAHIDPGWGGTDTPLPVTTPPFPEYPSGHSVQMGAVAEVLTDLFGDDRAFTDHTHDERGLPARSFPSIRAAAAEAALSRLYGGIHFRPAIDDGLAQGRCIGHIVNALRLAA
jgi:hypothetical protein